MKIRIGGRTLTGRAIDLREVDCDPAPDDVVTAVRSDADTGTNTDTSTNTSTDGDDFADHLHGEAPTVVCPQPGPAHEYVGLVHPGATVPLRRALAAAARSRGHAAPQDDEIAAVGERLADLDPPDVDLATVRRRVADATGEETALRERVAALRGRVRALREDGGDATNDVADAEAELADAAERLSAAETERIAAEQALAAARDRARDSRDRRRVRLRLQDREANLRRAAREHLTERLREEYEVAREAVPGSDSDDTDAANSTDSPTHPDAGNCTAESDDPVATALAVARVAALEAPVVLACDRFDDPTAAASWLDASVVKL